MIVEEKCIDNSFFMDDDGTPYLSFVRFNDGNNVWIAELEKDLITLKKETMRPCIHVSQVWEEVWPRVNEGSYILKHSGNTGFRHRNNLCKQMFLRRWYFIQPYF